MSQQEHEENNQRKQREEALAGWDALDTKFKLHNPIWAQCTRAAFHMGMTEEERLKLIAINLAANNMRLADQVIQLAGTNALQVEVPGNKIIGLPPQPSQPEQ